MSESLLIQGGHGYLQELMVVSELAREERIADDDDDQSILLPVPFLYLSIF